MANAGPNMVLNFVVQMKEVPESMVNLVDGGWPEPIAKAYIMVARLG